MCAAAQHLSKLVRYRAHIASGRDAHAKLRILTFPFRKHELFDVHRHWLQHHGFAAARRLVGPFAIDFLGRERRRGLLNLAAKNAAAAWISAFDGKPPLSAVAGTPSAS